MVEVCRGAVVLVRCLPSGPSFEGLVAAWLKARQVFELSRCTVIGEEDMRILVSVRSFVYQTPNDPN